MHLFLLFFVILSIVCFCYRLTVRGRKRTLLPVRACVCVNADKQNENKKKNWMTVRLNKKKEWRNPGRRKWSIFAACEIAVWLIMKSRLYFLWKKKGSLSIITKSSSNTTLKVRSIEKLCYLWKPQHIS